MSIKTTLSLIFLIGLSFNSAYAIESCTDSLDNDGDLLVDCNDPECNTECTTCGSNVIVNGSFEISSSSSSNWLQSFPGSNPAVIDGWTSTDEGTSNGCDVLKFTWPDMPVEGEYLIDLQSNSNTGICHASLTIDQGLKQSVATEAGVTYELSYYTYNWDTEPTIGSNDGLEVYIDGVLAQSISTIPETATRQVVSFVATAATTEIKFVNKFNNRTASALDNVRVVKTCNSAPEVELCADSTDNDSDGLADCLDSDCDSVCAPAGSNLIQNGSFEISSGSSSSWLNVAPNVNPDAIDNWTVINEGTSGDCDILKFAHAAAVDGSFLIDLQSNSNAGNCSGALNIDQGIKQSVVTELGSTYELSFYAYNFNTALAGGARNALYVYVGGVLAKIITPLPANATQQTLRFVATSTSTEIKFVNKYNWRGLSGLDQVQMFKVANSSNTDECTSLSAEQTRMDGSLRTLSDSVEKMLLTATRRAATFEHSRYLSLSAENSRLFQESWARVWSLPGIDYQSCSASFSGCVSVDNTAAVAQLLTNVNRMNTIASWVLDKRYYSVRDKNRVAFLRRLLRANYRKALEAVNAFPTELLSCTS